MTHLRLWASTSDSTEHYEVSQSSVHAVRPPWSSEEHRATKARPSAVPWPQYHLRKESAISLCVDFATCILALRVYTT
jgi:hypothetical protein